VLVARDEKGPKVLEPELENDGKPDVALDELVEAESVAETEGKLKLRFVPDVSAKGCTDDETALSAKTGAEGKVKGPDVDN
jgi:hypothetical protein